MAPTLRANDQSNPFQSIPDRNVFGLKPPPPPPSNEPPPAPPPQLAKVVLTGITSVLKGSKRALLEIEETEAGKQKTVKKPILREGERDGSIEVLSIDMDKGIVKIRNNGFETNLVFAEQKSVAAAPSPNPPGTMPMPGRVSMPGTYPGTAQMPGVHPGNPQVPGMNMPGGAANGPIVIPRRTTSDYPPGVNPAGSTATGFNPAVGGPTGATGYRAYPAGAYRGNMMPSAMPLPPNYQK